MTYKLLCILKGLVEVPIFNAGILIVYTHYTVIESSLHFINNINIYNYYHYFYY